MEDCLIPKGNVGDPFEQILIVLTKIKEKSSVVFEMKMWEVSFGTNTCCVSLTEKVEGS